MTEQGEYPVTIRSARYVGAFPRLRSDSWILVGQDGGQSIDLGRETLFVFSDTLLAPGRNVRHLDYRRAPLPTPLGDRGIFLANTAGLSSGQDLRQALAGMSYYMDEKGLPREILEPTPEEREQDIRFWPEHGICVDGKVYLYYLGIQTIDHSSIWGFRNCGIGLAVLDPQTGTCSRIRQGDDWCLWRAAAEDFHFGVQVIGDGEDVYVFGSLREGHQVRAILARVKADRITEPAAYEYLCSPQPDWHPDLGQACALGESAPEFSVSFNPYLGKYLLAYVDGPRKTLMLRTADRLFGPFSPPSRVGRVPCEPSSELVYLGFEHPKFAANGGERVYLSYCQPHFTPNGLVEVRFP